ncbi:rCG60071 [Rattus norvegicus]|uniref:RCG60071 n=1 Tax=Rattus norvegicus TaxID=10116 RepID=A6HRP2_RAT|nr:rCG60071 [Rattus norvegicus]
MTESLRIRHFWVMANQDECIPVCRSKGWDVETNKYSSCCVRHICKLQSRRNALFPDFPGQRPSCRKSYLYYC